MPSQSVLEQERVAGYNSSPAPEEGLAGSSLSPSSPHQSGLVEALMISLRRFLKRLRLLPLMKLFRALMVLGPWRAVPRFVIRRLRPVAVEYDHRASILTGPVDAAAIAEEIRRGSLSIPGALPPEMLARLRQVADRMPIGEHKDMHRVDGDVRQLSEDPVIKNVLRCYFQCEPELIGATLDISSHEKYRSRGLSQFHIDYPGWESLHVFVYLSDVTREKSYHVVAKGSHRRLTFRDILRRKISDEEAERRFGESLQAVTGPAGVVFFENTEAFHKRCPGNDKHRALLKLTFTSHRGLLSRGRTSREELARTRQLVQSARQAT